MPAKYVHSYKYTAPDGLQFDTLEEEIVHELQGCGLTEEVAKAVCGTREALVAILNQRERKRSSPSKPRGRRPRTGNLAPVNANGTKTA